MRKTTLIILCSAIALSLCIFMPKQKSASADASAEIAMELTTGTVLSESNADAKLPMASTTKIMTAIIIVEDCNLDETLTVPKEAAGVEGSSIYLKTDEEIDVRDLLYGLMLRSVNDRAAALAIHHSGSIEKFVEVMNARARQIGAQSTNFKNPSGLPDSEHYTTARDLCKIACYAMRNDTFKQIVSTKNYNGKYKNFANKNKMLYKFEGANGVKTGYTVKAGRCLVSSAERDGMDVVCVVLNCYDMYERSSTILENCLNDYKLIKIDENSVFMSDRVLCKLKNSHNLVVKIDEKLAYKVVAKTTSGQINAGDLVAKLIIFGEKGLIFDDYLYSIMNSK